MGYKLFARLKEFVSAINVEPGWLLWMMGLGMFYMPAQVRVRTSHEHHTTTTTATTTNNNNFFTTNITNHHP